MKPLPTLCRWLAQVGWLGQGSKPVGLWRGKRRTHLHNLSALGARNGYRSKRDVSIHLAKIIIRLYQALSRLQSCSAMNSSCVDALSRIFVPRAKQSLTWLDIHRSGISPHDASRFNLERLLTKRLLATSSPGATKTHLECCCSRDG